MPELMNYNKITNEDISPPRVAFFLLNLYDDES